MSSLTQHAENEPAPANAGDALHRFWHDSLEDADPEVAAIIGRELGRQRNRIELIASENIASPAVLEATGSVLTNKYAEGYPGRRYYGGCEYADQVETLAIERAKALFGCQFANVQPNSGSQMNQAVFLALLTPGDTFMGLDLAAGGHLTHGSPVIWSANGSSRGPTGCAAMITASIWMRSCDSPKSIGRRSLSPEALPIRELLISGVSAKSATRLALT